MGVASGFQELCHQYAIYTVLARPVSLPGGEIAAWFPSWILIPITGVGTTLLFLLFSTGRLLSKRWRVVASLAVLGIAASSAGFALVPGPLENFRPVDNPFGVGRVADLNLVGTWGLSLYGMAVVVSAGSVFLRFRRASGVERQQLKWFALAAALVAIALTLSFTLADPAAHPGEEWRGIDVVVILSFLSVPISTGIAILRHRLFDIDVVISKALVFGILAAFITVVYAVVVIGIGAIVGSGSRANLFLSVAATALVAIAFDPARRRVRAFANRLVYGQRATPYEAMSEFSHRMAGALSPKEVLPRMAEAAARGVGATRARVRVFLPDDDERSAVWPAGEEAMFVRTIAVDHQGGAVGEIAVAKPPSEPLTPAEERLLADLASQAGLALHNVRLTLELQARLDQISAQAAELRASRQRIVAAQDTERRRLERDIHDGAQQQLVSMAVKLRLAKQLIGRDPVKAEGILDGLGIEAAEAIDSLRDLARGIFPPLLADKGLVPALSAHIAKRELPARISAGDGLAAERFDPHVEAAVYFCCLEALQNAAKHAGGSLIELRIAHQDGWLEFVVKDAEPGFDPSSVRRGSGLRNMVDRVEALGGTLRLDSSGLGTEIVGRIPVRPVRMETLVPVP